MTTNTMLSTAIDNLYALPHAQIDRNIGQGHAAFLEQFALQSGDMPDPALAQALIEGAYTDLIDLQNWVQPYTLPDDYLFFLTFYGGFVIDGTTYRLSTLGMGPRTEEWYPYLMGDDACVRPSRRGVIHIADLQFHDAHSREVTIFLDLAGIFQQHSIVAIQAWGRGGSSYLPILDQPHAFQERWRILASSFTAWVQLVAQTGGTCGYS